MDEEGEHEHLGIPEDRALVDLSRQGAGGDRVRASLHRCSDEQLEDAVPQRLLSNVIAFYLHVAQGPLLCPARVMLPQTFFVTGLLRCSGNRDRSLDHWRRE